jgi:hypothetical protein
VVIRVERRPIWPYASDDDPFLPLARLVLAQSLAVRLVVTHAAEGAQVGQVPRQFGVRGARLDVVDARRAGTADIGAALYATVMVPFKRERAETPPGGCVQKFVAQ